ncbi:unnamed protein product [Chrysoparadoxa australica]
MGYKLRIPRNVQVERVKTPKGTHHPKLLLLFLNDGSLIVQVSTSNFVRQSAVDATWVQHFPPRKGGSTNADNIGSDFGAVLQDFVEQQARQMKEWPAAETPQSAMTPTTFMEMYLQVASLADSFDFSQAGVDLITTVPGEHEYSPNARMFYGQQRLNQCLLRSESLLSAPLKPSDPLILQPTSIGNRITSTFMGHLVKSYLGFRKGETCCSERLGQAFAPENTHIYWPSMEDMEQVKHNVKHKVKHKVEQEVEQKVEHKANSSRKRQRGRCRREACVVRRLANVKENKGVDANTTGANLFMLPQQWISLGTDVRSCVKKLELCPQFKDRVPHFKSYARVTGDGNIAWMLMASHCLSMGAQGEVIGEKALEMTKETLRCRNFEIGVLFHSTRERQYCPAHKQPKVEQHQHREEKGEKPKGAAKKSKGIREVPLPVPYNLYSGKAFSPMGDEGFDFAPYFHNLTGIVFEEGMMEAFESEILNYPCCQLFVCSAVQRRASLSCRHPSRGPK